MLINIFLLHENIKVNPDRLTQIEMSCGVANSTLLVENKKEREQFCSLNIIFHNNLYDLESTELKLLIYHFHNRSKVKRSFKRKRRRENERERQE